MRVSESFIRSDSVGLTWRQALAGDRDHQTRWRVGEGGDWTWRADGLRLKSNQADWTSLEWSDCSRDALSRLSNFVVQVRVQGDAEAAGLSFGPYKDFLAELHKSKGPCVLQVEVDSASGCFAFRVDGQLMTRRWWDSSVSTAAELIDGVLTLKAKSAKEVLFQELEIHTMDSSCRLSIILTCNRFLQRLRVALRNWCHQEVPTGAYELLVVNPQSPDGTHEHLAAVARSYPQLRICEIPVSADLARNKGMMINRALAAARGEWIWLTDADCLFSTKSVRSVLERVRGTPQHLYYGQRRHLSSAQTDALLSGRIDTVTEFDNLAANANARPVDTSPWGYTQIFNRSTLERVRYCENVNHFAHTDEMFVEACKRQGITVQLLDGMFCLHLDHPFAWYGTNIFL